VGQGGLADPGVAFAFCAVQERPVGEEQYFSSSKWKIFDNLRRSLTPISFGLLFIMGWALSVTRFSGRCTAWPYLHTADSELPGRAFQEKREFTFSAHIRAEFSAFLKKSAQTGLMIMALLSDACSNADAIMRAIKRTLITRRKILEWVTSRI
jgi:cyclic beta-1,2-glucan synthetase